MFLSTFTRRNAVRAAVCALALIGATPAGVRADLGDCAQPVTTGASATASDCLFILRSAIGTATCSPECICAPGGALPIAATDALVCLKGATGQAVEFDCPCAGATSTTTTTLSTTTTTTTTVTTTSVTTTTVPGQPLLRFFDNACLDYSIRAPFHGGFHRIRQRGLLGLVFDFAAIADADVDGLEDVPVRIVTFEFFSQHPDLGSVRVELGQSVHPQEDRSSGGRLEERRNNFPGVFELPPNVFAGDADLTLEPWLTFTVSPAVDNVLHHDEPIVVTGIVRDNPIAAEDSLAAPDADPQSLWLPDDSPWFGTTIESIQLTPLAAKCGPAASTD